MLFRSLIGGIILLLVCVAVIILVVKNRSNKDYVTPALPVEAVRKPGPAHLRLVPVPTPQSPVLVEKAAPVKSPPVRKDTVLPVKAAMTGPFSPTDEIVLKWVKAADTFTRLYVYRAGTDKLMLWRGIKPGIREYKIPSASLGSGSFYWYLDCNPKRQAFSISQ